MFAFDVSLCEISTFGANGEMQHSLFPPVLSKNVLISKSWVKPAVFLKPTKCWISSKIMQMFQNWVSDICKCFSSLDKNLLPLRSLVLLLFSKRRDGQNYNPASFTALKDWGSLLEGLGNVSGKVLWKIYNQDNSWHIKRKTLIAVLAFIWNFFISVFSLDLFHWHWYLIRKRGQMSTCSVYQIYFPEYKQDYLKKYFSYHLKGRRWICTDFSLRNLMQCP